MQRYVLPTRLLQCALICAIGFGLYRGCTSLVLIATFYLLGLGAFGFVGLAVGVTLYLLLLALITLIPAMTVGCAAWIPLRNIWIAIAVTVIVIPAYLTVSQLRQAPVYQVFAASSRPEGSDSVIVTRKETLLLELYCDAFTSPLEIFPRCWKVTTTAFDVYVLHAKKGLELSKVATVWAHTDLTDRTYGGRRSWQNPYSVDIKGWDKAGTVYLVGTERGKEDRQIWAVHTDTSGSLREVDPLSTPLLIRPGYSQRLPACFKTWDVLKAEHVTHVAVGATPASASKAPESIDIFTDTDGITKKGVYRLNEDGNLVFNPGYESVAHGDIDCK